MRREDGVTGAVKEYVESRLGIARKKGVVAGRSRKSSIVPSISPITEDAQEVVNKEINKEEAINEASIEDNSIKESTIEMQKEINKEGELAPKDASIPKPIENSKENAVNELLSIKKSNTEAIAASNVKQTTIANEKQKEALIPSERSKPPALPTPSNAPLNEIPTQNNNEPANMLLNIEDPKAHTEVERENEVNCLESNQQAEQDNAVSEDKQEDVDWQQTFQCMIESNEEKVKSVIESVQSKLNSKIEVIEEKLLSTFTE